MLLQGMSVLLEEFARDVDETLNALVVVAGQWAADVDLDVGIERMRSHWDRSEVFWAVEGCGAASFSVGIDMARAKAV